MLNQRHSWHYWGFEPEDSGRETSAEKVSQGGRFTLLLDSTFWSFDFDTALKSKFLIPWFWHCFWTQHFGSRTISIWRWNATALRSEHGWSMIGCSSMGKCLSIPRWLTLNPRISIDMQYLTIISDHRKKEGWQNAKQKMELLKLPASTISLEGLSWGSKKASVVLTISKLQRENIMRRI